MRIPFRRRRKYRQISALLPMSANGLALELRGKSILEGVDLKLRRGEIVALVGHNGAGKSFLLKTLHGLQKPSAGNVKWAGAPVREIWRHQALILQRPALLRRSVASNIDLALRVRGVRRLDRMRRVTEGLRVAKLVGYARRRALRLSIGEQQRVAFAQAWAIYPEALFLDEVTSALDPSSTLIIEDLIERLAQRGVGIVMASQDMEQVRRLASRVCLMQDGRLVADMSKTDFFAEGTPHEVKAFLTNQTPNQR